MSSGGPVPPFVAPPTHSSTPPGVPWVQYARLAAMIVAIVLAVVTGVAVVTSSFDPTEAELKERAELTGKHELLVGVGDDRPGLSYLRDDGEYEGFEIDIAYMIAAKLGFDPSQVRFLTVKTEDRQTRQVEDSESGKWHTADLIVASYSITKKREAEDEIMFSAPYLRTRISVVTRVGHPQVASVEDDLKGERVCTLGTGTADDEFRKRLTLVRKQKVRQCIEGLLDLSFDAVLTDAAILAGWVDKYRDQLRQHDISTDEVQRYGVNVGDNEPLRELVNLALYCSLHDPNDLRWENSFREHLSPLQKANAPQQIAEAVQPTKIPEPKVRRLPWEYWVPDSWAYEERPARCH